MAKSKQPDFPKIFPEDHWNRPPLRDRGDATADLTYGAVGMAITQWEMLEDAVADLFAVLVQGQYSIAQRVYGAITTSHVRREALRNAAEIVFRNIAASEEERNTFAQLLDNFSRASARRDDIAHAIVMGFQLSREPNAPMEDLGCFLLPPRYNSERNHPLWERPAQSEIFTTAKYRYIATDIMALSRKFGAFGQKVREFMMRLQPRLQAGR